jgi:hypothetical protein
VECDGATFHSSPTARDRDRVRHAILSALGWELIRLWSTDFFLDPDAAIGRVHDALTALLAKEREVAALVPSGDAGNAEQVLAALVEADVICETLDDEDTDLIDDGGDDGEDDSVQDRVVPAGLTLLAPEPEIAASAPKPTPLTSQTPPTEELGSELPRVLPDAANDGAPLRAFVGQFYDDAYLVQLRPVCLTLIDQAGPMTFVHLAEKIARMHGFRRTGKDIKKRVWAAVGRQRKVTKAPDGSATFWPQHAETSAFIAYRGDVVAGEKRPWALTPYVEKLGLAVEIVRTTPEEGRVTEMARRVGVVRLRVKTRDELIELLESAAAL